MTPMDTDERRFDRITQAIIGCAFKVGSKLGCGFAEKCYQNAMMLELSKAGLVAKKEVELKVWYDDTVVGEYVADIIVEGVILIELKACRALDPAHQAQCINYLAATRLPVCLLINFSRKVEIRRIAGPTLRPPSV
jgi:GxxExxY protein